MRTQQRGFQLLELVLVLALIAVAAAIGAGAWSEWTSRYHLYLATDALNACLQSARTGAMTQNAAVEVQVQAHRYSMSLRGEEPVLWRRFPKDVEVVKAPSRAVAFYSRGNAAPAGSFVLQGRGGQVKLVVSPSGRVRVED